ncbi:MAG: BMP family ABC transporter substrate-binding protein, partial [Clostridia bacterium]|nr:BMP family ABC transporter substrate-binding protein [Clostridia bacterium]
AANALMDNGCVLISQHADSMGAPSACEERNVPNVSYNGSTADACPNTFIVSSKIDWSPYFLYMIKSVCQGTAIVDDWCGEAHEGSVVLTGINEKAAAEGTLAKLKEVAGKLQNGEIHVFDTATFTVGGQTLTSYLADVNTDAAYTPDTEVIADGYFHESEFRSAPYFDIRIDGITLLNAEY